MKALLRGHIRSMEERDSDEKVVAIELTPEGTADVKGPDAKKVLAEMTVYVKPVVAQELRFGQELFIELSTEPPLDSKERAYCYHCGGRLDRKGPRDCPACS
jgi:hypothetical protein